MSDQTRIDRLNQGLDKLNAGGKQYIERLTSRLLHDSQDLVDQYTQGVTGTSFWGEFRGWREKKIGEWREEVETKC